MPEIHRALYKIITKISETFQLILPKWVDEQDEDNMIQGHQTHKEFSDPNEDQVGLRNRNIGRQGIDENPW